MVELLFLGAAAVGAAIGKSIRESRINMEVQDALDYAERKYGDLSDSRKDRMKSWISNHGKDYVEKGLNFRQIIDKAYKETEMNELVPWWQRNLSNADLLPYYPIQSIAFDPVTAYIQTNPDRKFRLNAALEIGQNNVQLQLAERADRLGSDLVRLASHALETDPDCLAVEVTDTIRTGVQRRGIFGTYWDDGAAITRTITVRKIR